MVRSAAPVVMDWDSGSSSEDLRAALAVAEPPHQLEKAVRRELMNHPGLRFNSLVVRRMPNGVCLDGVVECENTTAEIARIVNAVDGVGHVVNRLVVRQPSRTN